MGNIIRTAPCCVCMTVVHNSMHTCEQFLNLYLVRFRLTGLNCIKGASGKVIVDDKGIKDCWKEYMEKLMNEENEWYHKISAEVKEGPAVCLSRGLGDVYKRQPIYSLHSSVSPCTPSNNI